MHEVQALIRLARPLRAALTVWMFGSHRRLVFFFDQGLLWPKPGLLPHTSHTAATWIHSHERSGSGLALVTHAYALQQVIRRRLGRWVNDTHRRRPMIVPVVVLT